MDHLQALQERLTRERQRLNAEPDNELRKVWVMQIENEIEAERKFLGIDFEASDDELLNLLFEGESE